MSEDPYRIDNVSANEQNGAKIRATQLKMLSDSALTVSKYFDEIAETGGVGLSEDTGEEIVSFILQLESAYLDFGGTYVDIMNKHEQN